MNKELNYIDEDEAKEACYLELSKELGEIALEKLEELYLYDVVWDKYYECWLYKNSFTTDEDYGKPDYDLIGKYENE